MTKSLRLAFVHEYLVRECISLRLDTFRDIQRHWQLEPEEIQRLEIRSAPTFVENLIGAGACFERFGDLGDVPGFYRARGLWWIDIDERLARRGVILPIRDPERPAFIQSLRVFRSVSDQRPFTLRVRQERIAA
ncbi:MAG TPA: hypothetical protein VE961_13800 [Pyrinomonadaceae bacterium]|nr:hypothetical protein [Pyrinomonadaceae bacterium]